MADLSSQIRALKAEITVNEKARAPLQRQIPVVEKVRDRAKAAGNHPEVRRRDAEIRLLQRGIAEHDRRIHNCQIAINRLQAQ